MLYNPIVSTFKYYLYHVIYYIYCSILDSFYFPLENFGLKKNPINVTVTYSIKIKVTSMLSCFLYLNRQ